MSMLSGKPVGNSNFDQFRGNHGELPLQIR